jgi:hypothetical protein
MDNLGMVLAEQAARSMQAVDLVLQEVQAKALTAASPSAPFRKSTGFVATKTRTLPEGPITSSP